jgi:hypothetical protein
VKDPAGSSHDYGDGVVTNGWEGQTLSRLVVSYIRQLKTMAGNGVAPSAVPIYGVGPTNDNELGYSAVNALTEAYLNVMNSALDGTDTALKLADTLRAQAKIDGCPAPKFILIGYSQGAQSARHFAGHSDVVGVLNLGDPEQSPFAVGNQGTGAKGEGAMRFKYPGLKSVFDIYDSNTQVDKIALCHKLDPICDFELKHLGNLFTAEQHTNYFLEPAETDEYGRKLAEMVSKHYTAASTAKPEASRVGLDTMIAIDTTSSMTPYLKAAIASADAIAQRSLTAAKQARVGLVEYRDHSVDSFGARTVVPLTNDYALFKAALSSLKASGGGDTPEDVYSGIVTALGADWNPLAARSIVVIGDAAPHDPESGTCYTAEQVTRLLAGFTLVSSVPAPNAGGSKGSSSSSCAKTSTSPSAAPSSKPDHMSLPAEGTAASPSPDSLPSPIASVPMAESPDPVLGDPVALYGLSGSDRFASVLKQVAQDTGGQILDTKEAATAGDKILAAMDDAASAPEAAVKTDSVSSVGSKAVISAAASRVEKGSLKYEFDVDGDGVFETQTESPTVTGTFEKAGDIKVAVRVTGDKDRRSVASQTVRVLPAEAAAPAYSEASTRLANVHVSPLAAGPGTKRMIEVPDVQAGEEVSALLVSPQREDAFAQEAPFATASGAGGKFELEVPEALPSGVYKVLILTNHGRHATADITVDSPWAVWIFWGPIAVLGLLILGGAVWLRRRRREPK